MLFNRLKKKDTLSEKTTGKTDAKPNSVSGFTLIELLVVISIISILASLLLANFVGVRQRGRDAQRKSDLRQVQSALELYRSDSGLYPDVLPSCGLSITDATGNTTYMKKTPCDPLTKVPYSYSYDNVTFTYTLYACLENDGDTESDKNQNRTPNLQPDCTGADKTNVSFTLENP